MGYFRGVAIDPECFNQAIRVLKELKIAQCEETRSTEHMVETWLSSYWLSHAKAHESYGLFLTCSGEECTGIGAVFVDYCLVVKQNGLYLSSSLFDPLVIIGDDIYRRLASVFIGLINATGYIDRLHYGILVHSDIQAHEFSENIDEILSHLNRLINT